MNARLQFVLVVLLACSSLCSPVIAKWTVPVPLDEVNTVYHDKSPFISYDGQTMYFSRQDGPDWHYTRVHQAECRAYDPIWEIEEVEKITLHHHHVDCPWVSPDNLRMYYYTTGPRRRIYIAERASDRDEWRPGVPIRELNSLGGVATPSLTPDELTIVFTGTSVTGGRGGYDLWMATRPDRYSPFSNVINIEAANSTAWDFHPFISADGSTLFFCSRRNGKSQLFLSTRESAEEPFGRPIHLSFFEEPGESLEFPFLSADGSVFMFTKSVDGGQFDIYVSYDL